MINRTFALLAVGITLVGFLLREWYVLAIVTPHPFQGDSFEYMRYAYNLVHSGVFSYGVENIAPDDYRTPGYPLFLAALLHTKDAQVFVDVVRQAQVVVGALTVAGTILLARQWMPKAGALLAGLLIALWPQHIVATSSMLSEVLFGATLVGALLCASLALHRRSMRWGVAAGAVFSAAYLINPLIALFPIGALVLFWRKGAAKVGAVMVAVSLVAAVGWGIRSQNVQHGQSRAVMNLVQGSHPDYHINYLWRGLFREAEFKAINDEMALVLNEPHVGWPKLAERLAADPVRYAKWYAIEKPLLLWDRDIRLGQGGLYFLRTTNSPFESSLHPLKVAYFLLNPIFTALLLIYAARRWGTLPGLLVLYLTAIHVVFQAEPRYAIAYRPLEAVMVAGAILWLRQLLSQAAGKVETLALRQNRPESAGRGVAEARRIKAHGDDASAVPGAGGSVERAG